MGCIICEDLDRQIAAARDLQVGIMTEDARTLACEQEYELVLEMVAHLATCPTARKTAIWLGRFRGASPHVG